MITTNAYKMDVTIHGSNQRMRVIIWYRFVYPEIDISHNIDLDSNDLNKLTNPSQT